MLRQEVFNAVVESGNAVLAGTVVFLAIVHSWLLLWVIIVRSIREKMTSNTLPKAVWRAITQNEVMIAIYTLFGIFYFASIKPLAIFAMYRMVRLIQAICAEYADQPGKRDTKHILMYVCVCGIVFFLVLFFMCA